MKNTLKLCMISLLVLAGITALSCTDGTFEGVGGDGNLNIVNIPSEYNGKYCKVSTNDGQSFHPLSPYIQVRDGAVRAPLYKTSTGVLYDGSDTLTVTVTLYGDSAFVVPSYTKIYTVKFYGGSGLVHWQEPETP